MPRSLSLLVVEDNEDDALLFESALHEVAPDVACKVIPDGEEALAYLRHLRAAERPDLVILDLNLPRKDGFAVLAELKVDRELQPIPVVVFTTSNRSIDVLRAYAAGACSYLVKPARFEELRTLTERLTSYWTEVTNLPRTAHLA